MYLCPANPATLKPNRHYALELHDSALPNCRWRRMISRIRPPTAIVSTFSILPISSTCIGKRRPCLVLSVAIKITFIIGRHAIRKPGERSLRPFDGLYAFSADPRPQAAGLNGRNWALGDGFQAGVPNSDSLTPSP